MLPSVVTIIHGHTAIGDHLPMWWTSEAYCVRVHCANEHNPSLFQ